eukprot:5987777-Pyramimonas_sp.AAC.1
MRSRSSCRTAALPHEAMWGRPIPEVFVPRVVVDLGVTVRRQTNGSAVGLCAPRPALPVDCPGQRWCVCLGCPW